MQQPLEAPMQQSFDEPSGGSLLIVDDDEIVRALMRTTLEQDGFTVIDASDGAEALLRDHLRNVLQAVPRIRAQHPGFFEEA